jgi:chorismate synthase
MAGNTIGETFRVTTWGESHGTALGTVIDGCPSGMELSADDIQRALDRRRPAGLPSETTRREGDQVEILSGVFENRTTGTPITLVIYNRDQQSAAYDQIRDLFRPGHGDYTYMAKYGIRDHRGGGRASGRETIGRVAAGAVAAKIIQQSGIDVLVYTVMLGGVWADKNKMLQVTHEQIDANRLKCLDEEAAKRMEQRLAEAQEAGNSLGGIVEIVVRGCPAGLGEPVFDKMDADLAKALISIGTVKGVEIGEGFAAAERLGSENNDIQTADGFHTNHAGGILAGITNGNDIVIRIACKPIPSVAQTQMCMSVDGSVREHAINGRHDICVIPRVLPVCEAMVNIVLADHLLRNRAARI